MEDSKNIRSDIRIDISTNVKTVISNCKHFFENKDNKQLIFYAVGAPIGKLVNIIEALKLIIPGLYQINRLATVSYQIVGKQRLYPKMEVTLTFDKPIIITEGFQDKMPEEERKKILDTVRENRKNTEKERGMRGLDFRRAWLRIMTRRRRRMRLKHKLIEKKKYLKGKKWTWIIKKFRKKKD